MLILATPEGVSTARTPAQFGLTPKQLGHLRRFLDVTKAGLLFARGVILVEGVAEQLLLPVVARRLGRPLPTDGVAVINVGGVAFQPFTELFGDDRLPYRCAVVSDGDPPNRPDAQELEGGEPGLSPLAESLLAVDRPNIRVCLSRQTLEWDLAVAGNWAIMIRALRLIKPRVAAAMMVNLANSSAEDRANMMLEKIGDVKGRFAQELSELLEELAVLELKLEGASAEDRNAIEGTALELLGEDLATQLLTDGTLHFEVPDYLRRAVEWVTKEAVT